MTTQHTGYGDAGNLRKRAEEIAKEKAAQLPESREALSPAEAQRLLHELRVHQIELEIQNDELRRAQTELEAARARYFDLFDLAPVGYCTLSEKGLILEANLTLSTLLGIARGALVKQPLSRFILAEDQDIYYRHRKQLFESGKPRVCELRMVTMDGTSFWMHLKADVAPGVDGVSVCRLVMSDIDDRKLREKERELTENLLRLINAPGDFRDSLSALTASLQVWTECEAVGVRLREGEDYPYCETRGFSPEFVQGESRLCAYDRNGHMIRDGAGNPVLECMCGNILSGRFDPDKPFFTAHGSFWTNSTSALLAGTTEADRQSRTRNRCNGEGYESVALIPLRSDRQVFGLLQFNDRRPGRFTRDRIERMERLADQLAIALSRRQAAAALQENEEKFRILYENMVHGVFYQSADGTLVDINPAGLEMFGITRDQFLGRSSYHPEWKVVDEEHNPLQPEQHPSMLAFRTAQKVDLVVGVFNPAGKGYRWLSVSAIPQFKPGADKPYQVFATMHDITERKQAEKKLKESETRYAITLDAVNDGIWDWHVPSGNAFFSSPYYTMLGYDNEEFVASYSSWRMLVHPEDIDRVEQELRQSIETGKGFIIDLRMKMKSGKWRWVSTRGKAVEWDTAGKALRMVGTLSDITQRKSAEEESRKLQNQLLQAQKMESVGRLAGGVAHDFNNMLMVIIGNTEMVMEATDPSTPLYANLQEIYTSAQRSADLTRQLLAFARKQTIQPEIVDLNELLSGMIKMIQRLIGEDIDLVWKPAAKLWPVKMDPSQIDQILVNLAVNARDAIAGVGNLTIETENVVLDETECLPRAGLLPGEYVLLVVSDTGCGMGKDAIDHLFEPFYTTKEVGKGTGLGLATIYGIVKQNDGFVNVYSEPGQGTTFKVYLPRTQIDGEPEAKEVLQKPARGTETVLLVEDEPSILKLGTAILERYGYNVLAACTPGEARVISEQHPGTIHLLITDVVMPQMNGRDLRERIAVSRPEIKTLYMSGYTEDVIAHHGVLEKGIHFLQKPFSNQTLATKVREVLHVP